MLPGAFGVELAGELSQHSQLLFHNTNIFRKSTLARLHWDRLLADTSPPGPSSSRKRDRGDNVSFRRTPWLHGPSARPGQEVGLAQQQGRQARRRSMRADSSDRAGSAATRPSDRPWNRPGEDSSRKVRPGAALPLQGPSDLLLASFRRERA